MKQAAELMALTLTSENSDCYLMWVVVGSQTKSCFGVGGGGIFCCCFFSPYHSITFLLTTFSPMHLFYFSRSKYFLNVCLDLGLQEAQSVEYGVKQCQEMSVVLRRLIVDGKCFDYG